MAELTESKMNFAALKRVDPYAKSLLETAAHVALYTFINNEWEKTEIEGALFVYSRTGEPFHNILIMNRLNMENLVEPVTQGLDLQLQDPFLLYRTSKGLIYGIWFYDKEECVKIASTLTKIVKEACDNKSDKRRHTMEPVGNNVDIFSMLTKAQEEYNSKSPRKTQPEVVAAPLDLNFNLKETDPTPQSVMDFFAKASNGSKFVQDSSVSLIHSPGMFLNTSRSGPPPGLTRMTSVPIAIPPQNDVKPLLQRLMSNPVHSVEHIEKQQRAVTPQSEFVSMMRNGNTVGLLSSSNGSDSKNNLGFNVKPSTTMKENGSVSNVLIPQSQVENGLGFLRISDSPPGTVHSQQFFNSKFAQNHSPGEGPLEASLNSNESHRPVSAPMETHLKPALMPPVMFTSSVKKEDNIDTVTTTTPTVSVKSTSGNTRSTFHVQPEPLTKNQLVQAVNYLLKHDPDFINKLHEAYVKSFADLVS